VQVDEARLAELDSLFGDVADVAAAFGQQRVLRDERSDATVGAAGDRILGYPARRAECADADLGFRRLRAVAKDLNVV